MNLRLSALLAFTSARLLASDPHAAETPPAATNAVEPAHAEPAATHAPAPAADAHPESAAPAQSAEAAHATTDAPAAAAHSSTHLPPLQPQPARAEEIASLLRIGLNKLQTGDYASAEIAYRQVLSEQATPQQDIEALTGLGRTYRKKGDFTKAAAVYEKSLKHFPEDPSLPTIYLELGRTLRALGAYKQAIARFYSVINSTLKLPETGPDLYRQLARTAQFEIAETYFQSGDYTQANRFFSRLKLLDLAPEDRARAHFKSAYSLTLFGDYKGAAASLRSFLDQNPTDENVPEARYLLSDTLRRLDQINESLSVALSLLRAEQTYTEKDPKRWAYWQRKTGNQLANEFYERGDFGSALLIYQTLAKLSAEPSWNLPVTYQIGLCLERMQRFDRARESYQTIVDNVKPAKTDGGGRAELNDLAEMATWRLEQLSWLQETDKQLAHFFPAGHAPSVSAASAPAPTAPSAHDAHGSPSTPPRPL